MAARPSPRGFTLIELLVYIGIVTMAVTVFTSFSVEVARSAGTSRAMKEVQQNARTVMSRIVQDVRSSTAVALLAGGSELQADVAGTPKRYFLDGGVLKLDDGGSVVGLTTPAVTVTGFQATASGRAYDVVLTVREASSAATPMTTTLTTSVVARGALYP